MKKSRLSCKIIKNEELVGYIYSMVVAGQDLAMEARAGQFAALYGKDGSRLLPRPISICKVDREEGTLRFVYRLAGEGTREFSNMKAGDSIEIRGPLGNGFPLEEAEDKRVILVGGGIGLPPMLEAAAALKGKGVVVAGYKDQVFLKKEFEEVGGFVWATEDGSSGTQGTVLDAIRENKIVGDMMFACGPKPMLRALASYCEERDIPCWVSMEERMACGIGACLACTCKTKDIDGHSKVHNARICKDGPVFPAKEVDLS